MEDINSSIETIVLYLNAVKLLTSKMDKGKIEHIHTHIRHLTMKLNEVLLLYRESIHTDTTPTDVVPTGVPTEDHIVDSTIQTFLPYMLLYQLCRTEENN